MKDTWRTDLELLEFAEDGVEGTEIGCFCWRSDKSRIGVVCIHKYTREREEASVTNAQLKWIEADRQRWPH